MIFLSLVSFALRTYEACLQFVVTICSTAMSIFNDRIIVIIDYSTGTKVYFFPMIHLAVSNFGFKLVSLHSSYEFDLAYVKFVKNATLHSKISKKETLDSVLKTISGISNHELEKTQREFMKKYIFVELGGKNISKSFYQIGWSITDKMCVADIQTVFAITEGSGISLDFTDDNLDVEKRHSEQKVLDQLDLIKRS